jgi:hypothetical protein
MQHCQMSNLLHCEMASLTRRFPLYVTDNYSVGCVTSSHNVAHARRVAYVALKSGTTRVLVIVEGRETNGTGEKKLSLSGGVAVVMGRLQFVGRRD